MFPRPTQDNLGLLSCHGGSRHCQYRHRTGVAESYNPFDVVTDFTSTGDGGPWGPTDVTTAWSLTPSASGSWLAFASDRASAETGLPTVDGGVGSALNLFVADAVDPNDPSAGFINFAAVEAAPPAGAQNTPMWLSDDGLTLLFLSDRGSRGSPHVWTISRPTVNDAWDAATRIDVLSSTFPETSVTFPSLATLRARSCTAEGYLNRKYTATQQFHMRFPVCLGHPCP